MKTSRRSFHRALALVACAPVAAAGLLVAAPAAHAAMPACDPLLSTRLLTGEIAGEYTYLWMQRISDTETRLCTGGYPADFVLVVKSGVSVTPPGVVTTDGTGSCDIELVDLVDPLPLQVSLGLTASPTLCLGTDHETVTLSLTGVTIGTLPDIELWRGATPAFDIAFCAVEWARWYQAGQPSSGSTYWAYNDCQYEDDQIL